MITPNVAQLTNELFDWLDEIDESSFDEEDDKKLHQLLDALAASDPDFGACDVEASLARFKEDHQELFERAAKTTTALGPTKKFRSSKKKHGPRALYMICLVALLSAFCAGALLWYTRSRHSRH